MVVDELLDVAAKRLVGIMTVTGRRKAGFGVNLHGGTFSIDSETQPVAFLFCIV